MKLGCVRIYSIERTGPYRLIRECIFKRTLASQEAWKGTRHAPIWLHAKSLLGILYKDTLHKDTLHIKKVEIASSLDFLWKQQAKREMDEMTEMRRHTNQLLQVNK